MVGEMPWSKKVKGCAIKVLVACHLTYPPDFWTEKERLAPLSNPWLLDLTLKCQGLQPRYFMDLQKSQLQMLIKISGFIVENTQLTKLFFQIFFKSFQFIAHCHIF